MAKMNENFLNLKNSYLFIEIGKRVREFSAKNPDKKLIRMGIGDVTRPLVPAVVEAFDKAVLEMGNIETFRGYEDSGRGYDFLRNAIAGYYSSRGVMINSDEIFISDGAKSDSGNIGDVFSRDNKVLVTDPVYPVYVDTSIMAGREVVYLDSNEKNIFCAMPDFSVKADIIYLCSPNNPTGSVYNKNQLKTWVDYAISDNAVIIFDAAYEAFISDPDLPRSIFEIENARKCSVEICSLSKTAGFTGTRCGYTVIPEELELAKSDGEKVSFLELWNRRQGSKFNGVSYPVQRAAQAVFSEKARPQIDEIINYYRGNAEIMIQTFKNLGINYTGGENSPYIWFKCPKGMSSWAFFDYMINEIQVVGTPGAGFGKNGENWFRLTSFGFKENTIEAMNRFANLIK